MTESAMSGDIDEIMPIVQTRPQDRLSVRKQASKRKRSEARQCYLCESEWPDSLDWPPPTRKVKNGTVVTVVPEPDDQDSRLPDRTRRKKRRVVEEQSSDEDGTGQIDSLDRLLPSTGRTEEARRESGRDVFKMFLDRTADIPNFFNDLRNAVNDKEAELVAAENQRQREEAQQEHMRVVRETQRQARLAAENQQKQAEREQRARKRQIAQDDQRRQERAETHAVTPRNGDAPAPDLLTASLTAPAATDDNNPPAQTMTPPPPPPPPQHPIPSPPPRFPPPPPPQNESNLS